MRITGYRTLTTRHEWGRPVGDVNGHVASGVTDVPIVLVLTDTELVGVGLGAHRDLDLVFSALDGEDPRAVAALYDRMLATVFKTGHAGAVFGSIGALDMALWDLKAKAAGEPLWRLLGARDRFVPGYASGLDHPLTDDALDELYRGWAERGFVSGKLKGGLDVRRDLERLGIIEQRLRENTARPGLMIDANETWSRKQAIQHIQRIEEHVELSWVEEPVRRWDAAGLALVGRQVRASIATGENLTGLEQYRPLLDAGAVDVVQSGSNWGITHFLRVATLAHGHDLPVSPVGYLANPVAHAAAAVPNLLAVEVQDLRVPVGLRVDQQIVDGGIRLGDEPGLGIAVDEERVSAESVTALAWGAERGPHVRPSRAGLRIAPVAEHRCDDDARVE